MEKYIEIKYYLDGKLFCMDYSGVYPVYVEGRSFTLRTIPTTREKTRRPAREFTERFATVEKVHEGLRQVDEVNYIKFIEVWLVTPVDENEAEIDAPVNLS
jgi:hypothetical protein